MPDLELLEYYKKMRKRNIVLDFQGAISHDMLVGMAELVKDKFTQDSRRGDIVKKIFSVFIEMAQNIAQYSTERVPLDNHPSDAGAGIIVVTANNKTYTITSGNLANKQSIPGIVKHCEAINNMEKEALKRFYKKQIKSSRETGKKGGGIGLIDIVRKSGNPVHYEAIPVDNINTFFVLSVKIQEEKEDG